MLLMSLPPMKVAVATIQSVTSHPLFLVKLRDTHPTKVKPRQIPRSVTTRTQ